MDFSFKKPRRKEKSGLSLPGYRVISPSTVLILGFKNAMCPEALTRVLKHLHIELHAVDSSPQLPSKIQLLLADQAPFSETVVEAEVATFSLYPNKVLSSNLLILQTVKPRPSSERHSFKASLMVISIPTQSY